MDNLKQAYETLGLPENASRADVEKAFEIELRKSKNRQSTTNLKDGEESEYTIKLKAYKQIVEYEDRLIIEDKNRERYRKWGKFAGPAEKVDDFFRIYKARVIISLVAIIVLIFGINAFIDHREEQKRLAALPPVDLSILYVGNFMTNDSSGKTEELEQAFLTQFPEFKRVEVTLTYLPSSESGGQSDLAFQQKAMAMLATEKPDIYIMDKPSFDWLSNSGALQHLDVEAEGVLKPLLPPGAAIKARTEDDTSDHVYGVDVTNSTLTNQLPINNKNMIITVRVDPKKMDNVLLFTQRYLENMK